MALAASFSLGLAVLAAPAAQAQGATSREVVQPLPSPEVQRLNRALLELARRPRSVEALIEAGDASLAVDDLDAAAGFFTRAADINPSDPLVKLGMARVYLRAGRPVDALPLFNEAQAAGARPVDFLSDRALALDLIGDQATAQAAYSRALELAPQDDEARRRLAISHAISGNSDQFQATLAPLLEARDVSAFRTRAFGLAILGEQQRAEGIVNAVMPADLAGRINPYLAYMPRLTPAQQAAAANLGIFPRAADIGREDPRLARFAREGAAGNRLEPAGEPFGAADAEELAERFADTRSESEPASVQTSDTETVLPVVATREVGEAASPPARASRPVTPPASVADAFADLGEADPADAAAPSDAVNIAAIEVPREVSRQPEPEPAKPAHPRRIWVQVATGRDVDALRFDWRRFVRQTDGLLDDIEPHVTPWGEANRLLAGPLTSREQARDLVNALAEKGIETFTYTSPEGTEIQKLD